MNTAQQPNSYVLTIVGPDAVSLAKAHVPAATFLAADAVDAFFADDVLPPTLPPALAAHLAAAKADFFWQPQATRKKQVLLADLESTLIENEFLDDIAARAGCAAAVQSITAQAMAGELSFPEALAARVKLLQGTPLTVLQQALANWRPSAGAVALIQLLQAAAIPVWVVSSGFNFFVAPIAAALGCRAMPANEFELSNDALSGFVAQPVKDQHSKLAAVHDVCAQMALTPAAAAAVGDGANDILMLQAVGAGFGFRAKPAVASASRFNIRYSDLRAIAFAFGLK